MGWALWVPRLLLLAVSGVCWHSGTAALPLHAAEFTAGFATADITPPVGFRMAGGYSEKISTGVHDPLWSKAVVVGDGSTRLVLLGNDLCSVPRELTEPARRRASQATGIPFEQIIITATHTHGGPEYHGSLRDVLHQRAIKANGRDPREPFDYQAKLVDTWVQLVVDADRRRQPVSLSVVMPQQLGTAFNRRFLMRDGTVQTNPGILHPDIIQPIGPVDPDLPCVLVSNAAGQPIGALTVFAMHTAIYGGPEFGACYPGHLQSRLRERLQADEFVSIFCQGCAGDVNHLDVTRPWDSQVDYPAVVGRRLADTIAEALPRARPIVPGSLKMRSTVIHSPVAPLSPAEYRIARQLMEMLDQQPAPFLTVVDAWRKMFQHQFWEQDQGELPQTVQAIRLDADTAIVALPHEVFVELGFAIKSASPFRTTIVISLANDVDFYIPVRRAFEEGSYEPTTCPLLPGCGERLVAAAVDLLNQLKSD
jgi:neutral ceramidase